MAQVVTKRTTEWQANAELPEAFHELGQYLGFLAARTDDPAYVDAIRLLDLVETRMRRRIGRKSSGGRQAMARYLRKNFPDQAPVGLVEALGRGEDTTRVDWSGRV